MKKNICVIFGGKSTEHDISILTACQVIKALNEQKYNIIPIYINQNGLWFSGNNLKDISFYKNCNYKKLNQVAIMPQDNYLYKKSFKKFKLYLKIDCAIICCHGRNGEDGTIQGLLELAGIPYTSSGVVGSSIGLDKIAMKQMFSSDKIPVCQFVSVTKKQFEKSGIKNVIKQINLPVIVKPNTLGSSIGISVAKTEEELQEALELAFIFDNKVLVENLLEDITEVNISVLGEGENCVCSVTEQPTNNNEFLTFKDKYMSGTKQRYVINSGSKLNGMQNLSRIVPANISSDKIKKIENLAKKVFTLLNCKGVVRIDFMLDNATGKLYVNEINTIPGSFAFYLWENNGLKFDKLLDKLIDIAIQSKQNQNMLTTTFKTSVLNGDGMSNK